MKVLKPFRDFENHKSYDIGDTLNPKTKGIEELKKYGFIIEEKAPPKTRKKKVEDESK